MGFRCHAIFQVKSHWVCRNVYIVHCMLYFPIYIRDYEHNFLFTFLSAEWTTVWRIMSLCFSSRTKDSNSFSQNACTKEKKKEGLNPICDTTDQGTIMFYPRLSTAFPTSSSKGCFPPRLYTGSLAFCFTQEPQILYVDPLCPAHWYL